MNWKELTLTSFYKTAVAIQTELQQGHIQESEIGIEELIEALSRSDKRALKSQLIRLMMHVIKWIVQPQYRSRSWLLTIENARIEIEGLLEDEPHLKPEVDRLWDKCFNQAIRLAKKETGIKPKLSELSLDDVFKKDYNL